MLLIHTNIQKIIAKFASFYYKKMGATVINSKDYREKQITKVTLIGSVVNLVLTIFKIIAGVFGHSAAMIADGIHSASDLLSDIVVLIFVHISSKAVDKGHDFGHGKFETLATLIVSVMLLAVGVDLMVSGIKSITSILSGNSVATPGMIALIAAVISVLSKEYLYQYTVKEAKKLNSPVMVANAWHHRSDAFSSIGSFIGIGGAMLLGNKWSLLDPLTGCIISIMILWMAIKMAIPAINDLTDSSLPDDVENEILKIAGEVEGVRNVHNLKTRRNGPVIIMEAHIVVDPHLTLLDAHDIATNVEDSIREHFGKDTHISIHLEPDESAK